MTVSLVLADGTSFKGESFGYNQPVSGELVFNTAMAGYPEILTEPASRGQLIVRISRTAHCYDLSGDR